LSEGATEPAKIASDVGAGSRAIQASQPGTSAWDAQIEAIRRNDEIPGIDIAKYESPDTVASEHQIWFSGDKVIKATAYGKFGHSIADGPGKNSPLEYLRRIAAAKEAFGGSEKLIGKFENPDGTLGLIHSQDFVTGKGEGETPTVPQIEKFLSDHGFSKDPKREGVFVNHEKGIEISDAHPGNFIVDAAGNVVPIDVLARKFDASKELHRGTSCRCHPR